MQTNPLSSEQNQHVFYVTSVAVLPNAGLMAASLGEGVYRIDSDGLWHRNDDGLPEGASVNRLEADAKNVYACTSKGLFQFDGSRWQLTDISFPCYRIRGKGGTLYAATQYGVWYCLGDSWIRTGFTNNEVYDLVLSRQMVVFARENGIWLYDRIAQKSSEFRLDASVSSLAVLGGCLLGASGRGELVIGRKCGRFDVVRYGKLNIFSVNTLGGSVYACTDQGLYRIMTISGSFHLISVKTGFPVIDAALGRQELYLATYFEGIQTINLY